MESMLFGLVGVGILVLLSISITIVFASFRKLKEQKEFEKRFMEIWEKRITERNENPDDSLFY